MLPVGAPDGIPGLTPAAPRVGRAALGSTVHPPDAAGQLGVERFILAVYCAETTPVGVADAHAACRLLKSGCTGVGVPWRTNLDRISLTGKRLPKQRECYRYPCTTLDPSLTLGACWAPYETRP